MSAKLGRWRTPGALIVLLLAQLGAWAALHQDRDELEAAWREGSTRERLWALHVLMNRGAVDADDYGADFVRSLLADEDEIVREFAFSYDVCRLRPPQIQKAYLEEYDPEQEGSPHHLRVIFVHARKVGGARVGAGLKLMRREFEWLLGAMRGESIPADELFTHLTTRNIEMAMRRGIIDLDGNFVENPDAPETDSD